MRFPGRFHEFLLLPKLFCDISKVSDSLANKLVDFIILFTANDMAVNINDRQYAMAHVNDPYTIGR